MAACTLLGVARERNVPGIGRVYSGVAAMPTTATTGTLVIPKGAVTNIQLCGIATDEGYFASDVPTAALGSQKPTVSPGGGTTVGNDYITIARTGTTSAAKFYFMIFYD